MQTCSSCQHANLADGRFCEQCGAELTAPAYPARYAAASGSGTVVVAAPPAANATQVGYPSSAPSATAYDYPYHKPDATVVDRAPVYNPAHDWTPAPQTPPSEPGRNNRPLILGGAVGLALLLFLCVGGAATFALVSGFGQPAKSTTSQTPANPPTNPVNPTGQTGQPPGANPNSQGQTPANNPNNQGTTPNTNPNGQGQTPPATNPNGQGTTPTTPNRGGGADVEVLGGQLALLVNPSNGEPVIPSRTFSPGDTVYAAAHIKVNKPGHTLEARWYKASAGPAPVVTTPVQLSQTGDLWVPFSLSSTRGALPSGSDWRVEILLDGQVVLFDNFSVG